MSTRTPARRHLAPLVSAAVLAALVLAVALASAATTYQLTVQKAPSGEGTITSSPAGIACGSDCTYLFPEGEAVTLTATPEAGSAFKEWSGCDAVVETDKCEVSATEDRSVEATFATKPRILRESVTAHDTDAQFEGVVKPESEPTTYRFQYVTQAHYEGEGFAGADEAPIPAGQIPAQVHVSGTGDIQKNLRTIRKVEASAGDFVVGQTISGPGIQPGTTITAVTANAVGQFELEISKNPEETVQGAAIIATGAALVKAEASGLIPSTDYRLRLLAFNSLGQVEGEPVSFQTYSPGSEVGGSCPNEAFRTGGYAPAGDPSAHLPDCRAYEQASPVDKNGGNVGGQVRLAKASLQGDGVTFESQAGLPGGEGSQEFPVYMASREGGGWTTRGLLPPASVSDKGTVQAFTPDFAWIFDRGVRAEPGVPEALLARGRTGGPVTEVIPFTAEPDNPKFRIGAFSADDSTVLFTAEGDLAVKAGDPAPAPGKKNLYAWDRETGQLSLVGILPDGTVPAEGSRGIEGYELDRNTVAEDGSTFFSLDGQLYERLHPTGPETTTRDGEGNCVPDPTHACTVHVSASQRTDCAVEEPCSGTPEADPAGTQPAGFKSAGTDGSTAFFTSRQELTDNARTSPEFPPAAIGRASSGDGSEVNNGLALLEDRPQGVASDAEHLYWAEPGRDAIGRSELDGSNVEPDFITGASNPQSVAVHGSRIVWTNAADEGEGTGTIGRADLNGSGAATEIEQGCVSGASDPGGIDFNSTYVYWGNAGNGSIGRAAIGGSCAAADSGAEQTFWGSGGKGALAVSGDSIYTSSRSSNRGEVFRANLDGSGVRVMVAQQKQTVNTPPAIALDGSHLYWSTPPDPSEPFAGSVSRQDLAGITYGEDIAVNSHGDLLLVMGRANWAWLNIYGPDGSLIVSDTHSLLGKCPAEQLLASIAVNSQGYLYIGCRNLNGGSRVVKLKPSNPGSAPTALNDLQSRHVDRGERPGGGRRRRFDRVREPGFRRGRSLQRQRLRGNGGSRRGAGNRIRRSQLGRHLQNRESACFLLQLDDPLDRLQPLPDDTDRNRPDGNVRRRKLQA